MELLSVTRIEWLQAGRLIVTPLSNPSKMLRFIYRAAMGVGWEDDSSRLVCDSNDKGEAFARISRALAEEMGLIMQITPQTEWINISEESQLAFADAIIAQQAAQETTRLKGRTS
ncbi:MAG: hypothetical protein ABUL58_07550 [Steroidobacter sp.]